MNPDFRLIWARHHLSSEGPGVWVTPCQDTIRTPEPRPQHALCWAPACVSASHILIKVPWAYSELPREPFEEVRSRETGREFESLGSFWSQNLMMMVQRPGQAQDWGLLLYLMTIILSYHRHQQVSKTNRPSKLRSALTEHQRDFYINTGLMMPRRSIFDKVMRNWYVQLRSAVMIRDHYQDPAIAKWCCN